MTVPGFVLAVLACASPVVLIYLVLFSVPNLQHSRYRHALWDIRDDIVDDVIEGRLTLNKATQELLLRVHLAIRFAPEHTIRSGLTSALLLRGQEIPSLEKILTGKAVPTGEQARLLEHYGALQGATLHHLFFGSPSGWLIVALARLVPRSGLEQRKVRVEQAAKKELSALPRLYPDARPTLFQPDLAMAI